MKAVLRFVLFPLLFAWLTMVPAGAQTTTLSDDVLRQIEEHFFPEGDKFDLPDAEVSDSDARLGRRAMAWVHRAADKGDPHAVYLMGKEFLSGILAAKDHPRALALLRHAAEGGSVAAVRELALATYLFDSEEDQLAWARKAAETGNAFFQTAIGTYLVYGRVGSMTPTRKPSDFLIESAGGDLGKVDHAKAAEWYRRAAANGETDAARAYLALTGDMEAAVRAECAGVAYSLHGYGDKGNLFDLLKEDAVQAWIRAEAPKGNPTARVAWSILAGSYYGDEWGKDAGKWLAGPASAKSLLTPVFLSIFESKIDMPGLRRAAEAGNPVAPFLIWHRYRFASINGMGGKPEDGVPWLKKAAAMGLPVARLELGELYRDGKYVRRDTERAVRLLTSVAEGGEGDQATKAGRFLSELYRDSGDDARAVMWLYSIGADARLKTLLDEIGG